jgi:hypothetical protein
MMVSPEWYYEENLKGKPVDELKSRIRSLQRKIRRLQKEKDNPKTGGCMRNPSPEVELAMYYLYLQKARQTLMDTIEYLEASCK